MKYGNDTFYFDLNSGKEHCVCLRVWVNVDIHIETDQKFIRQNDKSTV